MAGMYNKIRGLFASKKNQILEASLARLAEASSDDFQALKAVRQEWGHLARENKEFLAQLYQHYFETVEKLINEQGIKPASLGDIRFVLAFASMGYLDFSYAREAAWALLSARHEAHLDLIRKALAHTQERITNRHIPTHTGLWGDVPGAMLELYYWHRPFRCDDSHALEAAQLVPAFYRSFPEQNNFVCLELLMLLPDASQAAADMIVRHVQEQDWSDGGWAASFATDMLGFYASREKPAHQKCPEIFTLVLKNAKNWPEACLEAFIDRFILYPLDIQPFTAEAVTARHRKAVQRIAVSAVTRKALAVVVKAMPASHQSAVQALLDEAKAYADTPKKFPMLKPSENRFKDFGLKLLVIEALMYQQEVLLPKFDIYEFAREYDKREISVEDDGYAVIPEVKKYFTNLAIPDELLSKVEALHQSSGLDGGPSFMRHLYPFWDPGSGDEPVPVTNKAIEDLALLPNLKRISGLENSKPGPSLCKALEERGVTLFEEDGKG